jgi:hypothetical protein
MNPHTQEQRKILTRYLNQYLSKRNLQMKPVMRNIVKKIETNRNISKRQYNSIIKFIEREKEFKSFDRDQIYQFFEPIIETKHRKVNYHGNTLKEHFV